MNGIAPEIRSAMFVSGVYLQVLFYDKTWDETGFRFQIAQVNRQGKIIEDYVYIGQAGPGEGVSLKDQSGNWMTWGGVKLYIADFPITLKNKAWYMVRMEAVKEIAGSPAETTGWDTTNKTPIQFGIKK